MGLPVLVLFAAPQGLQVIFLLAGLLAAPLAGSLATRSSVQTIWHGLGRVGPRPFILSAVLLAWGLAALAWSDDPTRSVRLLGGGIAVLVAATALFVALPQRPSRSLRWTFLGGLGAAIAFAIVDLLFEGVIQRATRSGLDWVVSDVNRPSAVAAMFVWPALALARSMWGSAALLLGVVSIAILGDSQAALLALVAGGAAFGLCHLSQRAADLLTVILPLGIVAMPWIALNGTAIVPESALALLPAVTGQIRLQIWESAAAAWQTAPLTGLGIEAIRTMTLPEIAWNYSEMRVNHPHNAFLQAALDIGLIGNALLAALVFTLARLGAQARQAPLQLAALTAACAVLATSWSIWATWWLATLAALGLACVLAERLDGAR